MATKLKHPAGIKLARPAGSGLKEPVTGLKKPVGSSSGMRQPSASPGSAKKLAGVQRQGQGQSPGGGVVNTHSPKQVPPAQQPVQPAVTEPSELEIGDRVLVGGAKVGTIAFLGPTQFARGVWAGVVLDTKDGKNNGCVNGVQYFECEPNRGLFARPEKLAPLPASKKPGNVHVAARTNPAPAKAATPNVDGATTKFCVGDLCGCNDVGMQGA